MNTRSKHAVLTKEEFARGCRASKRQTVFAVIGLFFLWGLLTSAFALCFADWFRSQSPSGFLFGFMLFVSLVLYLVGVFFAVKRIAMKHHLVCPSCGNWLGEALRMLNTNQCSRCHSAIYHEG
jgi:hypothetical protein